VALVDSTIDTLRKKPRLIREVRRTEPGLVALYDIRPGNGAGVFFQPRRPHEARHSDMYVTQVSMSIYEVYVYFVCDSRRHYA